jgi:hypothetical protein
MKKRNVMLCFGMLLILSLSFISAIAIGPGRKSYNFEPGFSETIQFVTRNDKDSRLEVYTSGVVGKYIQCLDKYLDVKSGQFQHFSCVISFPDSMTPGLHEGRVGVREALPEDSEGMIAVRTAVESIISVMVQYDGFYVQISLSADNVPAGNITTIRTIVTNWGDKTINLSLPTTIYSEGGEKVGEVRTNEKTISSLGKETLEAKWVADVSPGSYDLYTEYNHEGEVFNATGTFKVGDLKINLLGLNSSIYSREIGYFDLELESIWSESLNFDVTIVVEQKGSEIGEKTMKSQTIPAWGSGIVRFYWDIPLDNGDYTANVKISYSGKEETGSYDFKVSDKEKEVSEGLNQFILISAIVILVCVVIFFVIQKSFFKKKITVKKKLKGKKRK